MKIYLIIQILFISGCIVAQPNENILTPQQFESVSINNRTLKAIWETKGDELAVQNLFGQAPSIINEDNTPGSLSLRFNYNGFILAFANNIPSKGNLIAFTINSSAATLRIRGVAIKIGDNISKLGAVNINNDTDGGRSITYRASNDETAVLYIDFDNKTKLITEIGYFVLT